MRELRVFILVAALAVLSSGCVINPNLKFSTKDNVGTRWECQEIDMYFDVLQTTEITDPDDHLPEYYPSTVTYEWCPGELIVSGTRYPIEIEFGVVYDFSVYLSEDLSKPIVQTPSTEPLFFGTATKERNGSVVFSIKSEIPSILSEVFDSDTLTFVCE